MCYYREHHDTNIFQDFCHLILVTTPCHIADIHLHRGTTATMIVFPRAKTFSVPMVPMTYWSLNKRLFMARLVRSKSNRTMTVSPLYKLFERFEACEYDLSVIQRLHTLRDTTRRP